MVYNFAEFDSQGLLECPNASPTYIFGNIPSSLGWVQRSLILFWDRNGKCDRHSFLDWSGTQFLFCFRRAWRSFGIQSEKYSEELRSRMAFRWFACNFANTIDYSPNAINDSYRKNGRKCLESFHAYSSPSNFKIAQNIALHAFDPQIWQSSKDKSFTNSNDKFDSRVPSHHPSCFLSLAVLLKNGQF